MQVMTLSIVLLQEERRFLSGLIALAAACHCPADAPEDLETDDLDICLTKQAMLPIEATASPERTRAPNPTATR
jgi:hypothetical protein